MADKHEPTRERRFCPYCDEEIAEAAFPYCESCKVEIFYCPTCHEAMPRDQKVCPHCGADVKQEAAKGA
jgi:RNA polymerase subunit RPABC4/transcription elongation factor Spt4